MTTYSIQRVDLESAWQEQIGKLVAEAFGSSQSPQECLEAIRLTTETDGAAKSAYFAAIEGENVIGFNAFIAHELVFHDEPLLAFQSCWTATSSAHRGKRVFQNIILRAHDALAEEGASFMIGWPNLNSEPLFVHKLKYHREGSVKRNIPGPLAEWFIGEAAMSTRGISQNDEQLIALKVRKYGDKLFIVREDCGVLWGVLTLKATKFGRLPYFSLGGVHWDRPCTARSLVRAMRKKLPPVAYWQIVSEARNSLNPALGKFFPSSTNPLIWYPLKSSAPNAPFDFFAGMRDVY